MSKEIRIPYDEISDNQTITEVMERKFQGMGLDLHKNEVDRLEDDDKKKVRVLNIRNRKFFIMGGSK